MKDIHKNPLFYYILIPAALTLWPLLLWSAYIPGAEKKYQKQEKYFHDAVPVINKILEIDSERLDFASDKDNKTEFGYAANVEKIAQFCKISSANYELNTRRIAKSKGQKSQ